jgi:DNA-binding transcriptional regulator YdaS (Cro superfamily)
MKNSERPAGFAAAVKAAGGLMELARLLRIRPQAIIQWKDVPIERLLQIEALTGVPRHVLRPDLFEGYVIRRVRRSAIDR